MPSRNSFAAITEKIHPDAKEYSLYGENKIIQPNEEDFLITEKIIDYLRFFNKKGEEGATGEWKWLQQHRQADFIEKLNNFDTKGIACSLANMFRTDATYGYVSPSFIDTVDKKERVISNILCDIDTTIEFTDLEELKVIAADRNIGNPFGITVDELCILPDAPRHYYYSKKITPLLNMANIKQPVIYEIGSGYGGLTSHLKEAYGKNSQIINIDLLPGLICCFYYLSKKGYEPILVNSDDHLTNEKGKLYLLPAELFDSKKETLKGVEPDLVFNSRSLCEMAEDTCNSYINWINTSNTKLFYHENSNYLLFPDSNRHIEVLASEFKINK